MLSVDRRLLRLPYPHPRFHHLNTQAHAPLVFPGTGHRAAADPASVLSGPSSSNTIREAVLPRPSGHPPGWTWSLPLIPRKAAHPRVLCTCCPSLWTNPRMLSAETPSHMVHMGQSPAPSTVPRAQCPAPSTQSPASSAQSPEPRAQHPAPRAQTPASSIQRPEPSVQHPVLPCQPPQELGVRGFHTLQAPCHHEVHPVPSFTPGAQSDMCNSFEFTKGWESWGEHVHTRPVILTRPADRLCLASECFFYKTFLLKIRRFRGETQISGCSFPVPCPPNGCLVLWSSRPPHRRLSSRRGLVHMDPGRQRRLPSGENLIREACPGCCQGRRQG